MSKKMGRPKLPKDQSKTELLQIRITKKERGAIEQIAKKAGMTLSEWTRATLGLTNPETENLGSNQLVT